MESNNSVNFLSFPKGLKRKYHKKELYIIADNLSEHKHKDIKELIIKKENIYINYNPIYSSLLNQIEIWFNFLTEDILKGGIWKSKGELRNQIIEYIKTYNATRAKPF